ncbi:hypothetical protein JJC03_09105 [Flavobacterium oreochromis]|uniref:hypothetical protein n=1 Tax=Flavobacterium oreochromis TaxID=2906078 RepID=UPI001CE5EC77|nr:hypothetical protein [Flavobacterium oreochromis]QYS85396.1 hypothetical protein JJC03_09105 [Flavobacterium oreochromis]
MYAVKHLSLIEVIPLSGILISDIKVKNKKFGYINSDGEVENFILAFTQNNVEAVSTDTEDEVLEKAFRFFEKYMKST